jgi:hypothetical protein
VSKPTDLEFRAMVGGLGVFGAITELLMQVRGRVRVRVCACVRVLRARASEGTPEADA